MSDMGTRRKRLVALDAGAAYHHFTLTDPDFAGYFDEVIYLGDLTAEHLSRADGLLIPCRTPAERIKPWAEHLKHFIANGGLLVVMGETHPERWLNDIVSEPVETNYWWWLTEGETLGLSMAQDDHDLFGYLSLADCCWHLHGLYALPVGARSVIDHSSGKTVLFEDGTRGQGHLIVTSLDPMYHHGGFFMPATTAFLKGFIPWVRQRLDQPNNPRRNNDNAHPDSR